MKNNQHNLKLLLLLLPLLLILIAAILPKMLDFEGRGSQKVEPDKFNGARAYEDLQRQVAFGPRTPGSNAHLRTRQYICSVLIMSGWSCEIQNREYLGKKVINVVARSGDSGEKWIILGAHYDSRIFADQDPDLISRGKAVPGANDGASGVSVLLELGRVLPTYHGLIPNRQIWLVFFDAEDNGSIPGWEWIMGSRVFVLNLRDEPDAVVVIDMIGDKDLKIYQEKRSSKLLNNEIWSAAAEIGLATIFVPEEKYSILDDHIPFLEKGIPAIDIIDFDYPHWHTTLDLPDKVSPDSLQAVGDTLLYWLTH